MQAWLCTHLSGILVVLSKICLGGVSGNRRNFAAAKTLVVYYSYTNKCHEIVTTLTSQWDESKQYVMDKELTINQVAYKLGFQYPQHFTRLFKQQVGVTPSEYRN